MWRLKGVHSSFDSQPGTPSTRLAWTLALPKMRRQVAATQAGVTAQHAGIPMSRDLRDEDIGKRSTLIQPAGGLVAQIMEIQSL
jgi:hypothetical protein